MLVAAHIVPATTNDNAGDESAADGYEKDVAAKLTKLVSELAEPPPGRLTGSARTLVASLPK